MSFFVTSEGARVEYERIRSNKEMWVKLDTFGFHFSQRGWDELTEELFPKTPRYVVDEDTWLP